MSLIDDLIIVLGKSFDSEEVIQILAANELFDVFDDSPDRMVSSRKKGVSVCFEGDVAISVVAWVRPVRGPDPLQANAPFSGSLPFGIEGDMNQEQVRQLLGEPVKLDKDTGSWYYLVYDRTLILTLEFAAKSDHIRTVSISTESLQDDVNSLVRR